MLHTIYKNLPQNDQQKNVKYRWSECIQRARRAILIITGWNSTEKLHKTDTI